MEDDILNARKRSSKAQKRPRCASVSILLDFTADVGSGHHDSVGQHDEPAGQHSLPEFGQRKGHSEC
ncbi:hypothetical protein WJX82_006846 [Trebouxia sp. C0006]